MPLSTYRRRFRSRRIYICSRGEVEGLNWVAKVWKNNKELYKLADNGIAKSIVVHNGDVYVAGGHQSDGTNFAAKVWKNGKELYSLADKGIAHSIFIVERK